MNVKAISISKSICTSVLSTNFNAELLAVFENSFDIITDLDELIALVNPVIGNGPFHIVLRNPYAFINISKRTRIRGDGFHLLIDEESKNPWIVDLESVELWDPRPDWEHIRSGKNLINNFKVINETMIEQASAESLVGKGKSQWKDTAKQAIQGVLLSYSQGDADQLRFFSTMLCGLGPGLTPSGDDWLAGWLIGLRLKTHHTELKSISDIVLDVVEERTNKISQAFIKAAEKGELIESWHNLLETMAYGSVADMKVITEKVINFGATSGVDMLAGFLSAIV